VIDRPNLREFSHGGRRSGRRTVSYKRSTSFAKGVPNDRAVVLVDPPDVAKALAVFGKAGMRAVLDSEKFEIPGLYGRDQ